jgi:hypothetical protein
MTRQTATTLRQFYDQGWNDRIDGKPLETPNTMDYRDGWKDCGEYLASLKPGMTPERI